MDCRSCLRLEDWPEARGRLQSGRPAEASLETVVVSWPVAEQRMQLQVTVLHVVGMEVDIVEVVVVIVAAAAAEAADGLVFGTVARAREPA